MNMTRNNQSPRSRGVDPQSGHYVSARDQVQSARNQRRFGRRGQERDLLAEERAQENMEREMAARELARSSREERDGFRRWMTADFASIEERMISQMGVDPGHMTGRATSRSSRSGLFASSEAVQQAVYRLQERMARDLHRGLMDTIYGGARGGSALNELYGNLAGSSHLTPEAFASAVLTAYPVDAARSTSRSMLIPMGRDYQRESFAALIKQHVATVFGRSETIDVDGSFSRRVIEIMITESDKFVSASNPVRILDGMRSNYPTSEVPLRAVFVGPYVSRSGQELSPDYRATTYPETRDHREIAGFECLVGEREFEPYRRGQPMPYKFRHALMCYARMFHEFKTLGHRASSLENPYDPETNSPWYLHDTQMDIVEKNYDLVVDLLASDPMLNDPRWLVCCALGIDPEGDPELNGGKPRVLVVDVNDRPSMRTVDQPCVVMGRFILPGQPISQVEERALGSGQGRMVYHSQSPSDAAAIRPRLDGDGMQHVAGRWADVKRKTEL
jgi:hypothetical protein